VTTYHATLEGAAYCDDLGDRVPGDNCWTCWIIATGYIYAMCCIVETFGWNKRKSTDWTDRPTEKCDRRDRIDEARTMTGMEETRGQLPKCTRREIRRPDGIRQEKSRNVAVVGDGDERSEKWLSLEYNTRGYRSYRCQERQ